MPARKPKSAPVAPAVPDSVPLVVPRQPAQPAALLGAPPDTLEERLSAAKQNIALTITAMYAGLDQTRGEDTFHEDVVIQALEAAITLAEQTVVDVGALLGEIPAPIANWRDNVADEAFVRDVQDWYVKLQPASARKAGA